MNGIESKIAINVIMSLQLITMLIIDAALPSVGESLFETLPH